MKKKKLFFDDYRNKKTIFATEKLKTEEI